MRSPLIPAWVVLALAGSHSAFAALPDPNVLRDASSRMYAHNEYIFEMASVQGLAGRRHFRERPHEGVYSEFRKRGVIFTVDTEYNYPNILVGAAVHLSSSDDIARLSQIPGITSIRPVLKIPRPKPVNGFTTSNLNNSRLPLDSISTHKMTGVDKVHAQGNFGAGIKIGIIDTGIDYTHPLLGGAFGPGHKVIGGYDFVGDDYNGTNTPIADEDPLDQCYGHGTHVAGIIGASGDNPYGINGVASAASLAAYRIFGCTGTTSDKFIVDALIRAHDDGMDIITLSLGGPDGWTEGTASVVASRIAAQGKVVTIASGNDGTVGSWYTSAPGNAVNAISVASVDNVVIPVQNVTVKGVDHDPIPYLKATPFVVHGDFPIYATSTDTTDAKDACDPLPESTPDLSSFVVIVHRGTCAFTQKLSNIAKKGGRIFLIYNSDTGGLDSIEVGKYTAALISAADGKFLVNQFVEKAPVTLNFPQVGGAYNLEDPSGGLVSSFSTYGPTFDMYFKPAVAAPGGGILSTLPVKLGSYAVASGTSMATPFVAGAAALVLKEKGRRADVARSLRDLFQTTASSIPSSHTDGDPLQTVSQQGAGLIQVDRAIRTTTIVSPGQLTLNDTVHFRSRQKITIHNTSPRAVTYQLSHAPAGTALSVQSDSIFTSSGPVPLIDAAAHVSFSSNQILVLPGMQAQVNVIFGLPPGVDASRYPVYSGFINIASPHETLKVTYLGVAAALKSKTVLDNTDKYFGAPTPALLDSEGHPPITGTNYTLEGNDTLVVLYRLAFGSPLVELDLVDKDFVYKPTVSRRGWLSSLWPADDDIPGNVGTLGALSVSEHVPRNSDAPDPDGSQNGFNVYALDGNFANKTKIATGQYRVLLRALKVTGHPRREEDRDSWMSPVFGVVDS